MGLDAKAYINIKLSEKEDDYEFTAYVIDKSWEHKIKHLEKGKSYTGEKVYHLSTAYSRYNRFREALVILVGKTDLVDSNGIKWHILPTDMPFYELVDFADNEGCLDWETCSTIHADFVRYSDQAKIGLSEHFYSMYLDFMALFDSAKQNGVVVFS